MPKLLNCQQLAKDDDLAVKHFREYQFIRNDDDSFNAILVLELRS